MTVYPTDPSPHVLPPPKFRLLHRTTSAVHCSISQRPSSLTWRRCAAGTLTSSSRLKQAARAGLYCLARACSWRCSWRGRCRRVRQSWRRCQRRASLGAATRRGGCWWETPRTTHYWRSSAWCCRVHQRCGKLGTRWWLGKLSRQHLRLPASRFIFELLLCLHIYWWHDNRFANHATLSQPCTR